MTLTKEPCGPAEDEEASYQTFASASSQPTYTTAGTIYNPNSSQRLQPPTRRGRLLKLNPEASGFTLDATKFSTPRVMLPDAQFRSDTSVKVPVPAAIQQYSPLQQNYDRAVSPAVSLHQEPIMSSQGLRRHNTSLLARADSPPLSLFDKGKGKAVTVNDYSSSDDEDDVVNNALMNMTVKSLQNLASYPNPNQKNAQKALLRGTRPKAGSSLGGGPSRLSTPSTYRNDGSQCGEAPMGLGSILSEPSALYQRTQDSRWRPRKMASEAGASGTYHSAFESRRSTPSTNSDNTDSLAYMHLVAGSGVPKPLTAGPPGQRQYRPSTFESTFKALTTRSTASQGLPAEFDEDRPSFPFRAFHTVPSTPQDSVAEDDEYMSAPESSFRTSNTMPTLSQSPLAEYEEDLMISPDTLLYLTINSEPDWTPEQVCTAEYAGGCTCPVYERAGANDASSGAQEQGYPPAAGSAASWSHQPAMYPAHEEWDEPTGPMFPQSMGYPERLTAREIQEHNWRLNVMWYAGTGLLGDIDAAQVLSRPATHDVSLPATRNIYGAVGDGRPSQTGQDWPAAQRSATWSSRSLSLQSVDSDVTNGLALLDEILSKAASC